MASQSLAKIITEHPFFVGLEQGFCDLVCGCARNVRFENNGMTLAPPRRSYAGVMQHQELFWERIA